MKNPTITIEGEHRHHPASCVFTRAGKKWNAAIVYMGKRREFVTGDKPCMATMEKMIDFHFLRTQESLKPLAVRRREATQRQIVRASGLKLVRK